MKPGVLKQWGILFGLVTAGLVITSCNRILSPINGDKEVPQALFSVNTLSGTPTFTPFQPLSYDNLTETASSPGLPINDTAGDKQANLGTPEPTLQNNVISPDTGGTYQITPVNTIPPAVPAPPAGSVTIWIDPHIPSYINENAAIPPELMMWDFPNADLRLEVARGRVISQWIYVLVAPFPTVPYGISSEDLVRKWRGEQVDNWGNSPLLVDIQTLHMISELWGEPAAGAVQVLPAEQLLAEAWNKRPSWAIVPFESLEPSWKVLEIDGQSPLRNDFNPDTYPLIASISLNGDEDIANMIQVLYGPQSTNPFIPKSNRDSDRLTVLAMTGVTALVRATAYTMEQRGVLYPGGDVRSWLAGADLTHISNEVPFAEDCPFPNPVQQDVRFCSDPRYIRLLEDVGTDIIELTGDHFADWGDAAMYLTLDLYRQRGWYSYGGGVNIQEGSQAITLTHNGNRLAFMGCNAKGAPFAQAGPNHPGAVPCDLDWMTSEVKRLRNEGYLPIVTFQHFEYYTYQAQAPQIRDSQLMADAGAVIVSGSQAHQPQAIELWGGTLIHYGLGNLFFDQYEVSYATRQGFIDRHVFYDGKYIGTELLPILFIDYARPRPMTTSERDELLNTVFGASGW